MQVIYIHYANCILNVILINHCRFGEAQLAESNQDTDTAIISLVVCAKIGQTHESL